MAWKILDNYIPSYNTISVTDCIDEIGADKFFEAVHFTNTANTLKFIVMFTSRWGHYEIGTETMEMFRGMFSAYFMRYANYYDELFTWYDTKINMLESGTYKDTKEYIDLPNKSSTGEYVTSKEKLSHEATDNPIERKLMYQSLIKNIMLEFVEKFYPIMNLVYE